MFFIDVLEHFLNLKQGANKAFTEQRNRNVQKSQKQLISSDFIEI